MTKFKIFKLRFTTPLHLGDQRAAYDISESMYHSDSMFSALISAFGMVGMEIPEDADLGFGISSLFPYFQKSGTDNPVYFLPRIKMYEPYDVDQRKKIKKVEWLDVSFFNQLLNGKSLFNESSTINAIKGKYLTRETIDPDFISKDVTPRVQVSRDFSKDAQPFYMERLHFMQPSGLYFLVSGDDGIVEKALGVLKDTGIGTDRTVGNGFFEVERDEIKFDCPASDYITNLSMFIPESRQQLESMITGNHISYDFMRRGGWITDAGWNTFRKNSIYMLKEAGVFKYGKSVEGPLSFGKTVDLKPEIIHKPIDHPIFRVGKSIFLPIKMN